MSNIISYVTETGSVYQVDYERKLARRVSGNGEPTANFGRDARWNPYADVVRTPTGALAFIWQVNPVDGGMVHFRTTITSTVVSETQLNTEDA